MNLNIDAVSTGVSTAITVALQQAGLNQPGLSGSDSQSVNQIAGVEGESSSSLSHHSTSHSTAGGSQEIVTSGTEL